MILQPLKLDLLATQENRGDVAKHVPAYRRGPNRIEDIGNGVSRIQLNRGAWALIDSEESARVAPYRWSVQNGGYVRCGTLNVQLHRFLTDAPAGMVVDHRNWDTLDNRKSNLLVCTQSKNMQNRNPAKLGSVGLIGGDFQRQKPWRATFARKHIGTFATEAEAWARIAEIRELKKQDAARMSAGMAWRCAQ